MRWHIMNNLKEKDKNIQERIKRCKTVIKRHSFVKKVKLYRLVKKYFAYIYNKHTHEMLKFFIIFITIGLYLQLSSMLYLGLGGGNSLSANPLSIIVSVWNQFFHVKVNNYLTYLIALTAFILPIVWALLGYQIYRQHHLQGIKHFFNITIGTILWLSLSDTVIQYFTNSSIGIGNPMHYLSYWFLFYNQPSIAPHLAIAGLLGALPLLLFSLLSKKEKKIPNIHGSAHFATHKEILQKKLFGKKGIYLGRVFGKDLFLPGYEHVIVFAPTGGGKTTANAIINLLTWMGSCIALDLKLSLFEITSGFRNSIGHSVYVWALGGKLSHSYNALDFISSDPVARIDEVQRIAHLFIPDNPKVSDPFWYQNARLILIALIHYVIDAKEHRKSFGEINLIVKSASNFTEFAKNASEREDIHYICRNNFLRFLNTNHKTHKNIIDTLLTYLAIFDNPIIEAATARSDFDIRKLRKEKMTIYIGVNPADLERFAPLISIFYEQVVDAMLRSVPQEDEPHDLLLQIDEFAALRRMESFAKIGIFREYRMRALLYIQDISQLYSKYGRDDAKIFLNAKARIAYTQIDLESSTFLQSCLGNKTIEVKSSSKRLPPFWLSRVEIGENTNFISRPLLLAQEIRTLPKDKMLILVEGCEPIYADKIQWFQKKKYTKIILKPLTIPSILPLAKELYERAKNMSDYDRKQAAVKVITNSTHSPDEEMEINQHSMPNSNKRISSENELDRAI